MPSDSKAESATPKPTSSKSKSVKPSKVVTLKVPPAVLSDFPFDSSTTKSSATKSPPLPPSSEIHTQTKDETPQSSATDSKTASATKEEEDDTTPAAAGTKRKSLAGPKPGTKRPAPAETDGTPKLKGRPGPKRKKVDGDNGNTGPAPAAHKLGPKANQGAINAGLRALDRKGKPCRKWNKQGIALKTFTGVNWNLPYWQTPKQKSSALTGDAQSETTGSSDVKLDRGSSAVESEPSNHAVKSSGNPNASVATASSPVIRDSVDGMTAA